VIVTVLFLLLVCFDVVSRLVGVAWLMLLLFSFLVGVFLFQVYVFVKLSCSLMLWCCNPLAFLRRLGLV
jgi:hypothetical protein